MPVKIVVREEVFIKDLPQPLIDLFVKENTFPNPKIDQLERLGKWTGGTPRFIQLYRRAGDWLALPRGYYASALGKIRDFGLEPEITLAHPDVALMPRIEPAGRLFDYQWSALCELMASACGVMEAPTGSGKTNILLTLIAQLQEPTLIIVHTTELLKQTVERCKSWLGVDPGIIGGGKNEIRDITVSMVQTLARINITKDHPLYTRFGCVIVDECLVPGTNIDGITIESRQVHDAVCSFDERSHTHEHKSITHVFRIPLNGKLIRIQAGEHVLICTLNHKIFTRQGWTEAGLLIAGNEVLTHEKHRDNLQPMSISNSPHQENSNGLLQKNRESLLQQRMQQESSISGKFDNNVQDQSQICFGTNEDPQSNVDAGNKREGGSITQNNRELETISPGREWTRIDTSGSEVGGRNRMVEAGDCSDSCGPANRHTDPLQDRPSLPTYEDRNRSRWRISQFANSETTGCQENSILTWKRVDCVEILKPRSNGEYERLCPDGFVYNLEVADNHNYFANGILVQNCHHSPALTWADVLRRLPYRYKYGFTATAWRKDKLEFIIWRMIGPITAKVHHQDVADAGRIVWPEIQQVPTDYFYDIGNDPSQWTQMISDLVTDEPRNWLISRTIRENLNIYPRAKALVLVDRIEHAEILTEMMRDIKPALLTGALKKSQREEAMGRIRAGVRLSIATIHLLGEGIDVPGWDLLFLVSPISGGPRTLQVVGRIARPAPGKDRAILFDFVDARIPMLKGAARSRAKLYKSKGE